MTKEEKTSEYDSAWKDVIEELFEPFLEFFFPGIHKDINFSKKVEFLSKELRKIEPGSKVGKRFADVLVKVHLKDGSDACICVLIHIEVQGTKDPHFQVRIYVYHYRIYDKFREKGIEVISLAILTDEDVNYRPDEYYFRRWGFEHRIKIPIVKIIDYKLKEDLRKKLENSDNPMVMVVRAQLKSYEAKRKDSKDKYNIKWELFRECHKQKYGKKRTRTLLKFFDWIIRLPEDLEKRLCEEISNLEEENKMPYVPSWERRAKEEGIKEGIKEGKKEGKKEMARELIKRGIPLNVVAQSSGLPVKEIERLVEAAH